MSARKMFEELGFELDEENDLEILYKMKWEISSTYWVAFDKTNKTFEGFVTSDSPFSLTEAFKITIDELKAINKQVEELGWNK